MLGIHAVRRPVSRRSLFFAAALILCLVPNRSFAQSQDAAEAARQEKARKAVAEKKEAHVYTNEDLQRSPILTSDDHARVAARKQEQTVPQCVQHADAVAAATSHPSESLGEVARRYRREKAARAAERALNTPQGFPLPTELSQPALASPQPLRVQPLIRPAQPVRPSAPPIATARGRRDPFSHPAVLPAIPAPTIHPLSIAPAPPKPAIAAPHPVASIDPRPLPAPTPYAAMPKAQPRPNMTVAPAAGTTVQPGDSLWKLARQHLGKGSRWREWLVANPGLPSPHRIRTGTVLVIPRDSGPPSSPPAQAADRNNPSGKTISVQPGDSLWRIAQTQLGGGIAWSCLAQANAELRTPDRIFPGQSLLIPPDCHPAP